MAAKHPPKARAGKQTVGLMIELYLPWPPRYQGACPLPDCEALPAGVDARVDHCPHMEYNQDLLQCLQDSLPQAPDAGGHPPGHALERPRMIFHHPALAIRHLDRTKKQKKVICPRK